MVLVAIKNLLTGGPSKPLLPTSERQNSYQSVSGDSDNGSASSSMFAIKEISNPRVVSDVIIGLSDGLTVPFALTAGLSSLGDSRLVITGGLAELVSGAISMGLGGYLAARSESEYYSVMLEKEKHNYRLEPEIAQEGVHDALSEFHLSPETIKMVYADLESNEETLATFMVKMVRGVEEPESDRELKSALTIGGSYFFGGFIPLIPYFIVHTVETGLILSVIVMAVTLLLFGYFKTVLSLGSDCSQAQRISNGFSMLVTGGLAAGAAWLLVRVVDN